MHTNELIEKSLQINIKVLLQVSHPTFMCSMHKKYKKMRSFECECIA